MWHHTLSYKQYLLYPNGEETVRDRIGSSEIQRSSADYYARRYIGARRILDE